MLAKPIYIERATATFESGSDQDAWQMREPDYKHLIPNATLRRRMSRLVRMGVATGLDCLGEERVDAILTATGLGCLADTGKFMDVIEDNQEQLLSPTAFIQSTFNTVGAQVALLTGHHCYNNTYVHRAFSLETALIDASLCLGECVEAKVLVGAMDEMTPVVRRIVGRLRAYGDWEPGEGAAFFLLSGRPTKETRMSLVDMELFSGEMSETEMRARKEAFLSRNQVSDIWEVGPEVYKPFSGEYPTSISFGLWMVYERLKQKKNAAVLLTNSLWGNHSFMLIKKEA